MTDGGYQTGYFAAPGKRGSGVHVVSDGKPVCGYKPAAGQAFQWCAKGIEIEYVTCKACTKFSLRQLVQANDLVSLVQHGNRLVAKLEALKKEIAKDG